MSWKFAPLASIALSLIRPPRLRYHWLQMGDFQMEIWDENFRIWTESDTVYFDGVLRLAGPEAYEPIYSLRKRRFTKLMSA